MVGHIFGKAILVFSLCIAITILFPFVVTLCFIVKLYYFGITIKSEIAFTIELQKQK